MAKRKNAAALFEVIHADKRFMARTPAWRMPSPFGWLRRRDGSSASIEEAPDPSTETIESTPRPPSRLWSFLPPMPRMLLDADRHLLSLKVSYNAALVGTFAVLAIIALAFVIGRRTSTAAVPSLADQTTEELRNGPAQPEVLDVGPEGAPMAMASQQRSTAKPTPPANTAQPQQQPTWNDPKPPTTHIVESERRLGNYHYIIVQSYPEQEKQMAQDAADLLNKRGVKCTVETGLAYAPRWYVVVGLKGFDRVRNSPEYDEYAQKIEQIGLEFGGSSKFKKFEPRAFKWQEPKK